MFVDALTHAAAAGEAATGELLKQTRTITDDFAKKLQIFQDEPNTTSGERVIQDIIRCADLVRTASPSLSCKESAADSTSESGSPAARGSPRKDSLTAYGNNRHSV
ncbi:uncharacterized protein BXIN_0579 [Babesia sp. Xinjiang]|uniref:uncharacterized protein n=1 Tax=Babesia sp. Xinjiang TaxID=462227 RepID=UPI000A2410C2|nr:uncharacterized protein BXIN_0579 [Babesia sp. Xinjiang]ORM41853.1 hypothetical protein BXIN_0579 [Babesia sp. Xinjiang]